MSRSLGANCIYTAIEFEKIITIRHVDGLLFSASHTLSAASTHLLHVLTILLVLRLCIVLFPNWLHLISNSIRFATQLEFAFAFKTKHGYVLPIRNMH